jgi:hypothetical protein
MKHKKDTAALYKTIILAGMFLFISHYGYGQQSMETSFEPDHKYEIVITRMPSLSAELFGKEFVIIQEREVGLERWMTDQSSWLPEKNKPIMEFNFVPAEKELALEAWMTQTFKLEDRILEKDIAVEEWMLADTDWFERN